MTKHLLRSDSFFRVLLQTKPTKNQKELLNLMPDFVINDLFEIMYNTVYGAAKITPSQKRALTRYKNPILEMLEVAKKGSRSKRNAVYKQSGGFISALLPIALGLLAAAS